MDRLVTIGCRESIQSKHIANLGHATPEGERNVGQVERSAYRSCRRLGALSSCFELLDANELQTFHRPFSSRQISYTLTPVGTESSSQLVWEHPTLFYYSEAWVYQTLELVSCRRRGWY